MPRSIGSTVLNTPDNSLPSRTQSMAKADMRGAELAGELSTVLKDSARTVYGKQGAAAAAVGQAESNFSRDLEVVAKKLEPLGPQYLAEVGRELVERYAPLATPQARAKQQLRIVREALNEIEQALELIA